MKNLSALLLVGFVGAGVVGSGHRKRAQTPGAPPKSGTRLITLGTAGGPVPRAGRAQSSNLLIGQRHALPHRRRRWRRAAGWPS